MNVLFVQLFADNTIYSPKIIIFVPKLHTKGTLELC